MQINKFSKATAGRTLLFAAAFFWGISFVVLKNVLTNISPLYVLAIRFCGAALILLPACIPKLRKADKGYLIGGVLMGAALLTAYILQTYGLRLTTPGKNAFLTSVYCIIVPYLYWMFYKKRPGKINAAAAVICVAGIGLISLDNELKFGTGDALTLACGLFYALHIVISAKYVASRDPVVLAMLQFAVAGVIALICALVIETPPADVTTADILSIVFLTVVCTVGCLLFQVMGQKYTPPSQAAVILTFEAVFGAIVSVLLRFDVLTLRLAAGFALAFIAVLLSETKLNFIPKKNRSN